MKRFFPLALALTLAPAYVQAEPTWTGSTHWRYLIRNSDDGLGTKDAAGKNSSESVVKTHQIRMNLNAAAKGEVWDWGVGLRTFGSANSEWQTLQNNQDFAITVESAYLRPRYDLLGGKLSVTLGRAKTVFLYDTVAQALFDKDNRWDGLGWSWARNNYGLNLSQYILGARNKGVVGTSTFSRTEANEANPNTQSGFGYLFSFQPHMKFSFSHEIEGLFAVGYHHWAGTGNNVTGGWYTNNIHGGTIGPVGNPDPIIMDNARQIQIMTDWSLPMGFRFTGEYIQNKKVNYGTRTTPTNRKAQAGAYALSLAYGKVKKSNDWSASYSYVRKGIASVINTFSNGNMPADNIGHLLAAQYALADGLSVGAKVELYRELAKVGGDGLALASPNQNRRQSQDRFEFTAGMNF